MKIKCEYCDSLIDSSCSMCPNCGGVNQNAYRVHEEVPRTIDELKAYCARHNLPLTAMRVHIGEDYRGAKAFGIYKDDRTGEFVVYKNKADGSRAIRYQGTDEAFAVNELYLKCKERMAVQRGAQLSQLGQGNSPSVRGRRKTTSSGFLSGLYGMVRTTILVTAISVVIIAFALFQTFRHPRQGYYSYNNSTYYYYNNNWYLYDNDDWYPAGYSIYIDEDNWKDYYTGYGYDYNYGVTDFSTTDYYETSSSDWYSDDWDDDYDWDDSWDWDDSYDDWDSDW